MRKAPKPNNSSQSSQNSADEKRLGQTYTLFATPEQAFELLRSTATKKPPLNLDELVEEGQEAISKRFHELTKDHKLKLVHLSASVGKVELLQWLVEVMGISITPYLYQGCMIAAAVGGHVEVLKYVYEAEIVDQDEPYDDSYTEIEKIRNGSGSNLLGVAAYDGRLEVLEWLLSINKIDVHAKNFDDKTALDIAREEGHEACVKLLEAHIQSLPSSSQGLDDDASSSSSSTPSCSSWGNTGSSSDSADEKIPGGTFTLFADSSEAFALLSQSSAVNQDPPNLDKLVEEGHEAISERFDGLTQDDKLKLVHVCASTGKVDLLKWLVEVKDISITPYLYRGCMIAAAVNGHPEVLEYVYPLPIADQPYPYNDSHVKIEKIRNGTGENLVGMAALKGHLGALEWLLSINKIDAQEKNFKGKTALDLAREKGHEACAKALEAHIQSLANSSQDVHDLASSSSSSSSLTPSCSS